MELKYILVLTYMCNYVYITNCCGIMTHTEIATRGREYFQVISQGVNYNELLKEHDDAFQAGAPYPDAYYSGLCFNGIYHDISEDSHWTPFINATVNYIRREYPKPWDEVTEKLVAFLLATVSHQVADVNWHSIAGIQQGFLTTMGMINYHGSYPAAHTDGDFGGDVLNTYGLDMDYIPRLRHWYVPSEDLVNIYNDMYGRERMPIEVIENCTALLFLARLGENIGVIDRLYPIYARRSTFLLDRLQDYYLGGMDDMAVWSTNIWKHTIDMLDHGTDVCDLPHNPVYITCTTLRYYRRRYRAYQRLRRSLQNNNNKANDNLGMEFDLNEDDINEKLDVKYKDRGMYLSPNRKLRKSMKRKMSRYLKLKRHLEHMPANQNVTEPAFFYTSSHEYSRLGETLQTGDFNGDGYMDLAIGAPMYSVFTNIEQGRVHVVYGTANGLPKLTEHIEDAANITLTGIMLNGRFGSALTVADINADGVDDLIISAPSVGSDLLEYQGMVYGYYGSQTGLINNPQLKISCEETYCNFGWSLHGVDLNSDGFKDLIIGAPFAPAGGEQRGFAGILYSSDIYNDGMTNLTDLDLYKFEGTQNYEWFGYSVTGGSINNEHWLLVGAPSYRICYSVDCSFNENDIQAAGRVYGYNLVQEPTNYTFVIDGEHESAQFGFHVQINAVNNETKLFITAASEDVSDGIEVGYENITQGGFVHMYEWDNIVNARMDPTLSFYGDRPYGRLGSNIIVGDFNGDKEDDIIISSPLRSDTFISLTESGRAYMFSDISNIWQDKVSVTEANEAFGVIQDKLRFGYSSAFIPTTQGSMLVFGLPHSNTVARLAGEIAIYEMS